MTEPTPTPKNPESPNSENARPADENTQSATGFFSKVQRELNPEPIHPSEAAEIVVDPETLEQP